PAWVNTFKEELIKKSFLATGISPVNLNIILNRFRHITPKNLELDSSVSIAYSVKDWLKACSTLRVEAKDPRSVGARKLG
ncbi:hypothetical protein BU23DRAFT_483197, partial [Bimuria novae-zelandiae CBS 107.79]